MLKQALLHIAFVACAAVMALILAVSFDLWYRDLEQRRRAKWQAKQSRSQHPSSSGPRYE